MVGKEYRSAALALVPTTAVSERRYMRLLLGTLIGSSMVCCLILFRTANNADTERFFKSKEANDTVVSQFPGDQDNRSMNVSASSLLTTKHEQFSHSNELLDKTERLEDTVMDLPSGTIKLREFKCLGWRAAGECSPDGPRNLQQDLNCSSLIPDLSSGYCEIEDTNSNERFRVMKRTCAKTKSGAVFRCADAPGFAHFRAEAQRSVDQTREPGFTLPNLGNTPPAPEKGIAMVVYPTLVASAYATIRMLRDVLGCQLPIEIWFSPDEMRKTPKALTTLQTLVKNDTAGELTFREIKTNGKPIRFEAKIYAIYHSAFAQVLFLDADNVPVRDPGFLFETPEFVETGAVFWPDYWHPKNTMFYITSESLVWELLDVPFVDMFEQESGQLLIDRRRHAAPLQLVFFYAFYHPNYFKLQRLAWGDKDLFRFAWLKLEVPFLMIQPPSAVAGKMTGRSFCGLTMVQHDTNGEVLFLHRNQRKLMGTPHPEITKAKVEKLPMTGLDALPDDGYPDPEIWTHLFSFRNTSARSDYIVYNEQGLPHFPKWQRCYGGQDLDRNPHFYAQKFSDLSFGGLEKDLRRFAFEAVILQQGKSL